MVPKECCTTDTSYSLNAKRAVKFYLLQTTFVLVVVGKLSISIPTFSPFLYLYLTLVKLDKPYELPTRIT